MANVPATAAAAAKFVEQAEAEAAAANVAQQRAAWVAENFITHDTQILAAQANEKLIALGVELAKTAATFDDADGLPQDVRRKLALLKLALNTPGPADPAKTAEMSRILAELEAAYGAGKYCPPGADGGRTLCAPTDGTNDGRTLCAPTDGTDGGRTLCAPTDGTDDEHTGRGAQRAPDPQPCLDVEQITKIMQTSRDPERLLEVWRGWHDVGRPMREPYARFVALTNEGARDLGYDDAGAMWRSKYDMAPGAFADEVDRLWMQVKPLYDALHCYVRRKLTQTYGERVVPRGKPIPAHLLGNIWAQEWGNVYELVAPPDTAPGYDLTQILEARADIDEIGMVRIGERFFTSLGFAPLPETFWERSLFTKPRDRDVVCHASAWDVDDADDLRVKMCISKTADYFHTIHHELGHNFYQRAYNTQPYLYKNSANDGFHEAVGDTIALSVTPSYLVQIGLVDEEPPPSADIPLLLRDALDKIAFLPFGILIDKWRWKVFSGQVTPENYNAAWWELRLQYQGVAPPEPRGEQGFDPGAKYHIAANVPYARYFLARILQFQFHRALCAIAGARGPLNRCSIYGNKEAGARLESMLKMGQSRPWPEALEALTGQRRMDATAMLDYFAPLRAWLETQNEGESCGW